MKYATDSEEKAAVAAARWAARRTELDRVLAEIRTLAERRQLLESSLSDQAKILINAGGHETHYQTDYGVVRVEPHGNMKVTMVQCKDATDGALPNDWNCETESRPVDATPVVDVTVDQSAMCGVYPAGHD